MDSQDLVYLSEYIKSNAGNIKFIDLCLQDSLHLIIDEKTAVFFERHYVTKIPEELQFVFIGPDRVKTALNTYVNYKTNKQ